jgi:hypothetical protein
MALNRINIVWPSKGYAETPAYSQQPPATSPDMLNVMVFDPISQRARLAQRAGTGPYDLFNFATGTPIGTLTGGGTTLTMGTVELPAGGVSHTDPAAPVVNVPTRGCFTITPSLPSLDVSFTGSGCGNSSVIIGGQPNNTGSTLSGNITISPSDTGSGIGTGGIGGGFGTISIPVTQPPTSGGGGGPITDDEKPYLLVKRCSDDSIIGWAHQNILSIFNALPSILIGDECCYVTGQRGTPEEAIANPETPILAADDVTENCTVCASKKTWLQLTACDGDVDGSPVDVWLRQDHHEAAGGGDLYFQASDGGCYKCPSDAATTHTLPAHVVTVYLPKEDCADCNNSKIWYHIYEWRYNCVTGPGTPTYLRTSCLDPTTIPAEGEWTRVDVIDGEGVYEYYLAAGSCSVGDTAPTAPAVPAAPSAGDIGGFPPAECNGCTACGLMCLSEGTEINGLSWDVTGVCALANCSDFASVLTHDDPAWNFPWDGSFIQNDLLENTPSFGPVEVTAGDWSGTAQFNCAKTGDGGGVDAGELLVSLTKGPATLVLFFRAVDADADPPTNGRLPLELGEIFHHTSTGNCPPSGACDGAPPASFSGESVMVNTCCQRDGNCIKGTPQQGDTDSGMGMGGCR